MSRLSAAARISLIYVSIGVLWILLSDVLALELFPDVEALVQFQVMKGWFYVAATGLLLYVLIRRHVGELDERDLAMEEQMLRTTDGARAILRDFNRRMQLFRTKAERAEGFDRDLITLFDQVLDDTEQEIDKLGNPTDE